MQFSARSALRIPIDAQNSFLRADSFAIATYLLATRPKGISSIQLRRDLGISQSAAWFLLHRLREA